MAVWSWLILSRVSHIVKDLRSAPSADTQWQQTQGMPLMVAEAVSRACAPDGLRYPQQDAKMLAVLARDGVPVDPAVMPYGSMVELSPGRLGLYTHGGVIESHGSGLSVVPLDLKRAVRAWLIPGVAYFERAGQ